MILDPDSIPLSNKFFVRDKRTDLNLDELQKEASSIKLGTNVPESIKNEFNMVRDLIVFSYFKYEFFTLAVRLALFAYETAFKFKYVQSLGTLVVLKSDSKVISTLKNPSYQEISDLIWHIKKDPNIKSKKITVNDMLFPRTMKQIIKQVIGNGLSEESLTRYEAGIHLRNIGAHPESIFLLLPGNALGIVRKIMGDINELFDER